MCRQAHACDRELEENKRYALSNRFEQRLFLLLTKRGGTIFCRELITNVRRLEKKTHLKKNGPRRPAIRGGIQ
jgi:hypothetical protein